MDKEYDEMTNDDFEQVIMKANDEYDQMKDRVHELYEENERLKKKMNTMAYSIVYLKKEELGWIGKVFDKDLISIDDLISKLEDMQGDIDKLKEEEEDRERDIEDNYKPIDPASQYNIDDKMFH